jgi:2-hydroxy-6-oxonona-2,4-dienedioate hydrolase
VQDRYQQPRLDHSSSAFFLAKKAEDELLKVYSLTANDRWIDIDDNRVRVRITTIGEGEPVFVIPGNTGDMFPLIPLIAKIKQRKFVLFNRPGGGLSDGFDHERIEDIREFIVESIDKLLDTMELERVPILAHSMGCHWALWYAMARPERVKKLILMGNPGRVLLEKTPLPLRVLLIPGIRELAVRMLIPNGREKAFTGLRRMGTLEGSLKKLPEEFREAYFRFQNLPNYQMSSLTLLSKFNRDSSNGISRAELNTIKAETLILWGANDNFSSAEIGREISAQISRSTFVLVGDAGHMPWLDQPEQCTREIASFLSMKQIPI